jgi:hypothetical protein
MMTTAQAVTVFAVSVCIWIAFGSFFTMQRQIQPYVEERFKLRMSPKEAAQVIQSHTKYFPASNLRHIAGVGVVLTGLSLVALAVALLCNTNRALSA